VIANRRCERVARLRHAIASDQHRLCPGISKCSGGAAPEDIKAERGVADRPRHHNAVARFGAAPTHHPARRHPPERRDRDRQRTRRGNRIATQQRAAEQAGVRAKPAREWRQPGIVSAAQRQRQHKAGRCCALGRKIGQVHPERLARDRIRWIVGEEMHALDDGVGRDDNIVARWLQDRGIVEEIKRAGIGRQRLEIPRDQRVFTGWRLFAIGHDA
jgi:hypothetical protein